MQTNSLSPEFLAQMNDYWEAATFMAAPTYLYDNPLFKAPLANGGTAPLARKDDLSLINFPVLGFTKPRHYM